MLSAEGHFITPITVKPGCRQTHRGTQEWLLHTWVCAILISRKFAKTVSQFLQEALSTQLKCCVKTQLSINPQKVQDLDQYLMCWNTLHIQKWPFPHRSSPSSQCTIYCLFHCAEWQIDQESNYETLTNQPTNRPT